MHLFTYGSLMFDAVWQRVVTGYYENHPATLSGFVRKCVKNEPYPVVFRENTGNSIDGVLYLNIMPKDLALLDEFEGEYYVREPITVHLPDGSSLAAEVYMLKDQFRHIATDHDWDAEMFERYGLHTFLERYQGFLEH